MELGDCLGLLHDQVWLDGADEYQVVDLSQQEFLVVAEVLAEYEEPVAHVELELAEVYDLQ